MKIIILCILVCLIIFLTLNYTLGNYELYVNENKNIPKIIIQTWKVNVIPEKYKLDVGSVKNINHDFQYIFFSDDAIEDFLKDNYPVYYETYTKLPVKIQKIDFFRYIAVYHYGGFYFDLDMRALHSLNDLLEYDSVFPIDQHITNKCKKKRITKYCDQGMNILVGQYAFGAKPQNEFVKLLIDTIHNNIDEYLVDYKRYGKTLQYVYSTTGPDYVTDVYIKYNNKEKIHILDYDKEQFFGKYAKHNHFGTWK